MNDVEEQSYSQQRGKIPLPNGDRATCGLTCETEGAHAWLKIPELVHSAWGLIYQVPKIPHFCLDVQRGISYRHIDIGLQRKFFSVLRAAHHSAFSI